MKTYMSKSTTALAVIVGGALLATSAIAQTSAGTAPAKSNPDTTKSDAPKADTSKSTAPQADMTKGTAPQADSSSKSPATTGATAAETKSDATMKSQQPKASVQSGEQVKAVQQALKDKGFDPGEVDGAMGPQTQAALRDYQTKEGLKATGTADAETMAKLTAAVSMPAASPKDATSPGAKPSK